MWCRATKQPAYSWLILTRAERRAMSDLADELRKADQRETRRAKARGAHRGG